MLLVLGYPLVYNVVLSLKNVSVKNFVNDSAVYVGVQNYIELLQDPVFQQTIKNTLVFTVACLAIQFTIGFALALFFFRKIYFIGTGQRSDHDRVSDSHVGYSDGRKKYVRGVRWSNQ